MKTFLDTMTQIYNNYIPTYINKIFHSIYACLKCQRKSQSEFGFPFKEDQCSYRHRGTHTHAHIFIYEMKTYLSQLTIQGVLFFLIFACNEPHLFNVIFLGEILKSGARCGPGGERYSVEDLDYMTSFEFQSFFSS